MTENDNEVLIDKVRELENAKTDKPANTADILNEKRILSEPMADTAARTQMGKRTRRSFLVGGVAAAAGIFGWRWMSDENKGALLRRTFEFNEKISQMFYRPSRLAPEFSPDRVTEDRLNGFEGLEGEFDPASWTLAVGGLAGQTGDLILTMDDIKQLPRTEMTTEFKCIEGWSYIARWAGVRFSDFAAAYPPKTHNGTKPDIAARPRDLMPYVSLTTPDEKYYVGWDLLSILHPQTMLAYEINGAPLSLEHGAPLRLATATKYGIKQIKRIGRIEYTGERPADYWANEGYDWYAGF